MENQNNENIDLKSETTSQIEDDINLQKASILKNENSIFEVLYPNYLNGLPLADFDLELTKPKKRLFVPNLSCKLLARRIYIEMLKAIRSYGKLERIAPNENKSQISNLKNQMEILSLAMLNIYGKLADKNKVPFFAGGGTNISNNYQKALLEMYDKIYHIHNLVFALWQKCEDDQIKRTLLIVYTNLKSQLSELNNLASR